VDEAHAFYLPAVQQVIIRPGVSNTFPRFDVINCSDMRSLSSFGYVLVPTDQARFFTPERLAGKRQADNEIATANGTVHDSGKAVFVHLDNLGAAES
jgi:hypothetical protein